MKSFVPRRYIQIGPFQIQVRLALIFVIWDSMFSFDRIYTTCLSTKQVSLAFLLYGWLPSCIHFAPGCQCDDVFNPVCGMNGLTYPSVCRGRYKLFSSHVSFDPGACFCNIKSPWCTLADWETTIELIVSPTKLVLRQYLTSVFIRLFNWLICEDPIVKAHLSFTTSKK